MYEWEAMLFFYIWLSNILKIYPCPNWPGIFAQKHLVPSTKLNRAPTLVGCWGNEREPSCPTPHPGGARNLAGKTDAWTRNRREYTACWRCLSHTDRQADLPRRSQQTQCGRGVLQGEYRELPWRREHQETCLSRVWSPECTAPSRDC